MKYSRTTTKKKLKILVWTATNLFRYKGVQSHLKPFFYYFT